MVLLLKQRFVKIIFLVVAVAVVVVVVWTAKLGHLRKSIYNKILNYIPYKYTNSNIGTGETNLA